MEHLRIAFTVVGFFLAVIPTAAQFDNMRTTSDGSVLYFTTPFVQRGSGQPAHGKAFRIDADGLSAVMIREVKPSSESPRISNNYDIEGFDVSGDGLWFAVSARRDCFEVGCASYVNTTTTLQGPGTSRDYPGPAQISRNGRYLVNTSSGIPRLAGMSRQWDLLTGESWELPWPPIVLSPPGGHSVADTGVVVGIYSGDLYVFRRGVPQRLTFGSESIRYATIDGDGTSVVFVSRWPRPHNAYSRIRRLDLITGELRTVVEEATDFAVPSVSGDGSVMTVLARRQAHVVTSDGAQVRQLTFEDEGVHSAVLSDDARVAYAVTNGGRILRIDVASGSVTTILGRTLSVLGVPYRPFRTTPGSALLIRGTGLDASPLSVTVGGLTAPIIRAEAGELLVQTPWEAAPSDSAPVQISAAGEFVFEAPLGFPVQVVGWWPEQYGVAMHEGLDREVSPEDPARPNEVVHFIATGLGAVNAPVTTGVPQPEEPQPLLSRPLTCGISNTSPTELLEVPYSGLLKGSLGLYRVSIRLPDSAEPSLPGALLITCEGQPAAGWLSLEVPFRR